MDFDALNNWLRPAPHGTPTHGFCLAPYPDIEVRQPGKYGAGDFVVCVTAPALNWHAKPFTHRDLFADLERRAGVDAEAAEALVAAYFVVVQGDDPSALQPVREVPATLPTLTFLHAVQCLALAEERRYSRFSAGGGGRWLPWRYSYGIAQGHFTAAEVAAVEKSGKRGIEQLEGKRGLPPPLRQHLTAQRSATLNSR